MKAVFKPFGVAVSAILSLSACAVGDEAESEIQTPAPGAEAFNSSDSGTCQIRGTKRVYSYCSWQEQGPIASASSEVRPYVEDKLETRGECEGECYQLFTPNICGFSDFTSCQATFTFARVPECSAVSVCYDEVYYSPLTPVSGYEECKALARAQLDICRTDSAVAQYLATPSQPGPYETEVRR